MRQPWFVPTFGTTTHTNPAISHISDLGFNRVKWNVRLGPEAHSLSLAIAFASYVISAALSFAIVIASTTIIIAIAPVPPSPLPSLSPRSPPLLPLLPPPFASSITSPSLYQHSSQLSRQPTALSPFVKLPLASTSATTTAYAYAIVIVFIIVVTFASTFISVIFATISFNCH